MFGVDYSKRLDIQEETVLLEMIPISTITNVKTTTNDIKPIDKKKELISKDEAQKDNKTVMKDSEFDNQNVSQKKIEPKIIENTKPDPKPEIQKEEPKIEEKKAEPKPEVKNNEKITEDREKVHTKDIKKEPDIKKDKEKKEKKTEPKLEAKKIESKKNDKKPKDKPKEDKQKKKVESDDELANSVLKSLQEGGKKSTKNNKEKQKSLNDIMENAIKGDTTTDYDAEGDLSMSEIAAIRSQISQAWRVTAFSGGKENKNMRVIVKITVNENGLVSDIKVKDKSMPVGIDRQVYNAFVDSVMRAITAASPLKNLPEEKYSTWSEMELTFDSSGMIY